MKRLLLASAALALTLAMPATAQQAIFGSGATSASSSGVQGTVLGGQGSIGNGAAASASGVTMDLASGGIAAGGTTIGTSGAFSATGATGSATFGSIGFSVGQAGQFSGVGGSFINGSDASAFGGFGFTAP